MLSVNSRACAGYHLVLYISRYFCDLQDGRILEYKVTDKKYILQKEVTKIILIFLYCFYQ